MTEKEYRSSIEAILFAAGDPVDIKRLAETLEIPESAVKTQLDILIGEYAEMERGITIIQLNDTYQMVSVKQFAPQVRKAMDLRRNIPLSQAAMEVLAVIAYNQPVTKSFVEQVRGVDCSGVIGSLTTKGLIEEKGRQIGVARQTAAVWHDRPFSALFFDPLPGRAAAYPEG